MTHTKGPWKIVDTIRNQLYVEAVAGGFICDMQLNEAETGQGRVLADARLIAAAPAMQEALERLVNALESGPCPYELIDNAKAALALAGKEPK